MRLPLHIDTGYYVSNHTVVTGRLRFAKGWNAHFAGCSKVIPELFYSLVYLVHGRSPNGWGYKRAVRWYASLLNYLTAVAVGTLVCHLAGGNLTYYYAGLVVYALLSSECQYGVYFECGEFLGTIANVVSILFLSMGLRQGDPWLTGSGALLWAMETFFVKLSSAIGLVVICVAIVVVAPWTWVSLLVGTAVAVGIFVVWLWLNGCRPWNLIGALAAHEASFGQRADWRTVVHRLSEKAYMLIRSFRRQPLIPALALTAVVLAPFDHVLILWVYLAAVGLGFVIQATDCWYYQIPLLPPIAIWASVSVVHIAGIGMGIGILTIAAALWLVLNTLRARRLDDTQLNEWCCRGYLSRAALQRNTVLNSFAPTLRSVVASKSLLVYGPLTQAYVLVRTGYDTPLVAPDYHLNEMAPGWQSQIAGQISKSPPDFVLDSAGVFAAQTVRSALGLDYRLTHVFHDSLRLFQFSGRLTPRTSADTALTYRPQTNAELQMEEEGSKETLRRIDRASSVAGETIEQTAECITDRLSTLLESLHERGLRRIAVYGAGRFTARHADVYRNAPVCIAVVVDDRHARYGENFLDWPVASLKDAEAFDVEGIIISTDRFASLMADRARRTFTGQIPVFTLDNQLLPGSPRSIDCCDTMRVDLSLKNKMFSQASSQES